MKKARGFTIVELLIVIVVIAILAAITVVAYNGIQVRARDTARTTAVSQIRKALESYKAIHGSYPSAISSSTNVPAGFSGAWGTTYYSYSVATDGSWLKGLTDANIISSVPVDVTNNNDHYFVYYSSLGLGVCKEPFYMLAVVGYESSANIPTESKGLNCTEGAVSANWTANNSRAVFSNIAR